MTTEIHEQRMLVLAAYVLHLVGAIAAVPSLIALILNYLKRGAGDPDLLSHHQWMIETFWWAVVWFVVGAILTLVLVGWLIMLIAWLWYLYRHVRGLLRLIEGRPAPFSG
ncbi:MAG TPA: hypothetical protein VM616_09195 [Gammaproteobacteria bacterium]|nr:hypothetical protein [Gammaproteobacteria bacterium]